MWDDRDMVRGVAVLGIAVGIAALTVARHDPQQAFVGAAAADQILELAAGWSLMLAGLASLAWRPHSAFGVLLTAAGFAWFLPEWSNPGIDVSLAFTLGLVGLVACPPLLAHATLVYPRRKLVSGLERGAVGIAYVGAIGLFGLFYTVVFDPVRSGCAGCPRNLLLLHADAGVADAVFRWGLRLGVVWALALCGLLAWRVVRPSGARVVTVPVIAPAIAYLAFVAIEFAHSTARNVLANAGFDLRLLRYEAVALLMVAGGVAWGIYRARRVRASMADLVLDLAHSSKPGWVSESLGRALGDPTLRIGYRYRASGDYVDANGHVVELGSRTGRVLTPLQRAGRTVAMLEHDCALVREAGLIEDVIAVAQLPLENESMGAEVRAQLERLRSSRARVVAAEDLERRRLERDLHDGAQQRLVGLSLLIQLLRTTSEPNPALEARLDAAEMELRETLAELRELAHGIYPAVLADEGLASAIETLQEQSPADIRARELPRQRFDPAVEATAYFAIATSIRRSAPMRAAVTAAHRDGRLVVDVDMDCDSDEPLIDVEDRVGAIDGTLSVRRDNSALHLHVELPCGSP
jgi:signal transduction histidine kinase